jgi:aryl-alcohol dehydrogenase-like predicted oxidoreductase
MDGRTWNRELPNQKSISALGFGCSSIWAKSDFSEDDAQAILNAAWAEGINHFDTGPSYGPAIGEERLGRFLAQQPSDRFVITTKVGTNLVDGRLMRGFSADLMMKSFEGSLRRLGLSRVDILYLHGPSLSDLGPEVFDFFNRLKDAGKITYSGINSFEPAILEAAVDLPIDAVMLQYSVADVSAEQVLGRLARGGKIILSGTALGRASYRPQGFIPWNAHQAWYLLRMMRHQPTFLWKGRQLSRHLKLLDLPPVETAIRFVTSHPLILSAVFGTSRRDHLVANARAGHGVLAAEDRLRLHAALAGNH